MQVLEKILEEIDNEVCEQRKVCEGIVDTPGYRLYEKTVNIIKGIIQSHMNEAEDADVHTNNGWIPCSERLPSKEETFGNIEFIVMIEGAGSPTTLFYNEYGWNDGECNFYEVIAWQKLPEPYKPEEPKQQKNTQQEMEDFWRDK